MRGLDLFKMHLLQDHGAFCFRLRKKSLNGFVMQG